MEWVAGVGLAVRLQLPQRLAAGLVTLRASGAGLADLAVDASGNRALRLPVDLANVAKP